MSDQLWPQSFRLDCEAVFGKLGNTTYKMLNRRVVHAFDVWRQRYGGLTPEQHLYAWEVLSAAVRSGQSKATVAILAGEVEHEDPYRRKVVLNTMEAIVHDDRVHAGFKRRADLVDVTEQLAKLSADGCPGP